MGAFAADEEWTREQVADAGEFARLVEDLKRDALPEAPLPPDWVAATMLWYVEGDEWLGRLSIRHQLTPVPARDRRPHRVRRPPVGPAPRLCDEDADRVPADRGRAGSTRCWSPATPTTTRPAG